MTLAVSNLDLAGSLPASPFHQAGRNVNTVLAVHCGARLLHHADCFRVIYPNPQIAQDIEGLSMDFLAVFEC
jgi:hypothetical protein